LAGRSAAPRSRAVAEQLQLDGDAGEEREQDAGGDEPHDGLHHGPAHETHAFKERAQIADVEGGVFSFQADIGKRASCPAFGGAGEQLLDGRVGQANGVLLRQAPTLGANIL
jgi:hypothetical protein